MKGFFLTALLMMALSTVNAQNLEVKNSSKGINIEIRSTDFPDKITWEDASRACQNLGKGWRLPTIEELKLIYKELHKNGLGDFRDDDLYWTSDRMTVCMYAFGFHWEGGGSECHPKLTEHYVRLVRNL
jgi:hypothetical protein